VKKIEFGLKGDLNYFWYRARVNLSTALPFGLRVKLPPVTTSLITQR